MAVMVFIMPVITSIMPITMSRRYNHHMAGWHNYYRAMIVMPIVRTPMIITTTAVIANGYGFAVVWIVTAS